MSVAYSQKKQLKNPGRIKRYLKYVGISSLIALVSLLGYWAVFSNSTVDAPAATSSKQPEATKPKTEKPKYKAIDLQPVIDSWVSKQSAEYSIVVYDAQAKKNIASHNDDQPIFAASLYKIYVAYLSLLDMQEGRMNPKQILSGGFTREECIDKMIRESYSPCGEAMMADMTPISLNKRVKDMGMTGTTFNGIQTSARDSARILRYINEKRDLNDKNTAFLKDAMLTQPAKFKRGLQTGAPKAQWETKVGWNLDINYHDIGIMTMPDKRVFYVAILSKGNGSSAPIANFAQTIYSALN